MIEKQFMLMSDLHVKNFSFNQKNWKTVHLYLYNLVIFLIYILIKNNMLKIF